MRGWWFGGHGVWVQFAHAGHCFAGGGWEDVVGGFECGPRFDDTAGGACESMCIAVIIVLGYPTHDVGLGHPVLDSTSPFFNTTSRPLFDLLCPLIDLLFGLIPRCGHFVCCFINYWRGGRFSGCGSHWEIDEWWGVRDGRRDLVG